MIYLIIAIILVVIIAPMIRVLPSRQQRQQMVKRRTAMAQGIGVELVKIEDPDPDPKKYQTITGRPLPRDLAVASYRLHRGQTRNLTDAPSYQLLRHPADGRVQFEGEWFWPSAKKQLDSGPLWDHLSAAVSELPGDVVRVEEKNNFISIYWHEAGEVSEVIDFLKRTAEINPAK